MTTTTASAPGKIILFGEHAVVYGQPAIAIPVTQVRAEATIEPGEGPLTLIAPDLGRRFFLADAPEDDPLALVVRATLRELRVHPEQSRRIDPEPSLIITVRSTIPVARGLGSGAAVSVAIIRALAAHFGAMLPCERVAALAYEAEVLYHGTPSGIDNTVIAYEQPIFFMRGRLPEGFTVGRPLLFAIGDTGITSLTKQVVGGVRERWQADRAKYDALFEAVGDITRRARRAIELGAVEELGRLMDENQARLREMEVSSAELEALIDAAKQVGALGAKLSGAGRGGNIIALLDQSSCDRVGEPAPMLGRGTLVGAGSPVVSALRETGAREVIVTEL
jgi:mevalonate kinase